MAPPRRTGSMERGVSLRAVVADVVRKLEAEARVEPGQPTTARSQGATLLLLRAREIDGRLGRWGLNVTTNAERTEDLLECQDLLAQARKLGV